MYQVVRVIYYRQYITTTDSTLQYITSTDSHTNVTNLPIVVVMIQLPLAGQLLLCNAVQLVVYMLYI
jgi:hypothetical protein